MANAPLLWQRMKICLRMRFTQKRCILLRKSDRSTVIPNFFFASCYKHHGLTLCKILKNSVTPFFFKLQENFCFLEKHFFHVIEIFYFLYNARLLWYDTAHKI